MLPFVAFAVGAYLQYDVAMDIRDTVQIMAPCFMAFFLLTNLQAAIIFAIVVVVVSVILTVIAIIVAVIAAIVAFTVAGAALCCVCLCLLFFAESNDS